MVRGFDLLGELKKSNGSKLVHFGYGAVYSHSATLSVSGLSFTPKAIAVRVGSQDVLEWNNVVNMTGTVYIDVLGGSSYTRGYDPDNGSNYMTYSLSSFTPNSGGFSVNILRSVSLNHEMLEKDATVYWIAIGI